MAKVWSHFFVMIWVLYIISSGIYLFSRGFLLSRQAHTETNSCKELPQCIPNDSEELVCSTQQQNADELLKMVADSPHEYCLSQKARIILIVIDALKYEFGLFDSSKHTTLAYENKLPVFNEMLAKHPHNARFMKLVADAPTTTLQRLKGITTGSLPTFIDVGSNFATAEINEDNIIDQITRSNLSAVFLGDATWTDLYPKRFLRQYSYPSFDIYDLDTVDTAINQHLPAELKQTDWSLLVAHFLGVDHCGHKYGPLHPEMSRKLNEMNVMIEKVIAGMDDDTTLLVIGDHGMTSTGDHGGDTNDEINSMIFAYSKRHRFVNHTGIDTMDQIDLPSTMATILGVPIPFSNLGTITFDIVPDVTSTAAAAATHLNTLHTQLLHTWQNMKQMLRYFDKFKLANSEKIPATQLDDYAKQFNEFAKRFKALQSDQEIQHFCQDVRTFLKIIANDCREIWAQFDANLISQGLIFTAVTTFFVFLLTTNLKFNQFELIFTQLNVLIIYLSNFGLMAATPVAHVLLGWDWSVVDILRYTCVYGIALLAFLLIQNWDFIAANWSTQQHFTNLFTRSVFLVAASTFFSNSYIIYEQKIMCYLLCGALVVFLYKIRKEYAWLARLRKLRPEFIFHSSFFKLATFTIVTVALLRLSHNLHLCREEHGNCNEFKIDGGGASVGGGGGKPQNLRLGNGKTKSNATNWLDLMPILILALFATFSRLFLRKCGNLSGFSPHVLLVRYGPIVAAVACSLHFFTSLTNYSAHSRGIYQVRIDALAWIVYSVFALQVIVVLWRPLMLFILQKPNRTFNVSPFGCVVPQIVMKMKQMYENVGYANDEDAGNDDIPIVYGLATVYSSVLYAICVGFSFVLALLLGPLAANGIFIVLVAAALILVLNAVHRYQRCTRLAFCLQPEVLALVSWHLLAHYSFYATAHQPTLSQINWHAAFVGRTALYDHNNVISAILILLNTFGGHVLVFLLYPLLVIAPNAIYTIYPSLAPRRTAKMVIKNQNGTKQREIVKVINEPNGAGGGAEVGVGGAGAAGGAGAVGGAGVGVGVGGDGIGGRPVNVTTFAGLDSENEHLDIAHGELSLYENEDLFFGQLYKTGVQFIILQSIRIFSSMIACTIHCRHLMVWKIFAPRFIFEAIATYFIFGAILIGFLVVVRIHAAVSRLISVMSEP